MAAALESADGAQSASNDTWSWWQARRLRYNLALIAAGWLAYILGAGLEYAFGRPMWESWLGAVSITLFLGTGYLVLMGIANVLYLLGPAIEAWVRPRDLVSYRRTAFAMGFWGSAALPFLFPLVHAGVVIGRAS
jgi:hypothetical protein